MDIYSILASKPHNKHYLDRYWKFIQSCQEANKNLSEDVYLERHHICPRAKDLFPEYESFRNNPWNLAILTGRQHLLAHLILSRVFETGSMRTAFVLMTRVIKRDDMSNLNRKYDAFRRKATALISKQMKEEKAHLRLTAALTGSAVYTNGVDEIKLLPGVVVPDGYYLGRRPRTEGHSDNQIAAVRAVVAGVTTYNDGVRNYFVKPEDDIPVHFVKGMKPQKERNDFLIFNGTDYKKLRKGEFPPEGYARAVASKLHKFELRDIPFFYKELTIIDDAVKRKQKYEKARAEFVGPKKKRIYKGGGKLSTEHLQSLVAANTDVLYYNNGTVVKKFREHPGEGWVLGALINEELKQKRREATIEKCLGSVTYNDGIRNYTVRPGEEIQPHWVKGMKKQKERTGFLVFNGTEYKKMRKGEKIPEGYKKANATSLHKSKLEVVPYFHSEFTPK